MSLKTRVARLESTRPDERRPLWLLSAFRVASPVDDVPATGHLIRCSQSSRLVEVAEVLARLAENPMLQVVLLAETASTSLGEAATRCPYPVEAFREGRAPEGADLSFEARMRGAKRPGAKMDVEGTGHGE